jgi:hypothetical protein
MHKGMKYVDPLKPSGNYMYTFFNNLHYVYNVCTVYGFCVILRINSDYFTKQF